MDEHAPGTYIIIFCIIRNKLPSFPKFYSRDVLTNNASQKVNNNGQKVHTMPENLEILSLFLIYHTHKVAHMPSLAHQKTNNQKIPITKMGVKTLAVHSLTNLKTRNSP